MIKKVLIVLASAIFFLTCNSTKTYMGYKVIDESFKISGGEVITLPITNAGPIPAENDYYKIEVAGFSAGPSKEHQNQTCLNWNFAFSAKKTVLLQQVKIELVAPGNESKVIIQDRTPIIKRYVWSGSPKPILLNKRSTPWLFESGSSTFIFKITIKSKGNKDSVLYQPSIFSEQSKMVFRNMANKNNN